MLDDGCDEPDQSRGERGRRRGSGRTPGSPQPRSSPTRRSGEQSKTHGTPREREATSSSVPAPEVTSIVAQRVEVAREGDGRRGRHRTSRVVAETQPNQVGDTMDFRVKTLVSRRQVLPIRPAVRAPRVDLRPGSRSARTAGLPWSGSQKVPARHSRPGADAHRHRPVAVCSRSCQAHDRGVHQHAGTCDNHGHAAMCWEALVPLRRFRRSADRTGHRHGTWRRGRTTRPFATATRRWSSVQIRPRVLPKRAQHLLRRAGRRHRWRPRCPRRQREASTAGRRWYATGRTGLRRSGRRRGRRRPRGCGRCDGADHNGVPVAASKRGQFARSRRDQGSGGPRRSPGRRVQGFQVPAG